MKSISPLIFLCFSSTVAALDLRECNRPLGMESGAIGSSQITASSSFDNESTGPQHARAGTESGSGAWCPGPQINARSKEWLQVSFPHDIVLTAIKTQGRYDNGRGNEFAQFYRVEYWRESIGHWQPLRTSAGLELLPGNRDTRSVETLVIGGGIVAEKVRIFPVSNATRTICMRVELYGCSYKGALESYSAPEGSLADGLDLRDSRFDGRKDGEGEIQGGLGKLFDGALGHENHEGKPEGWVGWRRGEESGSPKTITLNFTFSSQRNLSAIQLHTSNFQKYNAQPFSAAIVEFSANGRDFSPRAVKFRYHLDTFETLRWVKIDVPDRIARAIRVHLTLPPSPHWLLLSEVQFESGRAAFAMSAEVPDHVEVSKGLSTPIDNERNNYGMLIVLVALCSLVVLALSACCCRGARGHGGRRGKAAPSPLSAFPSKAVYQVMLEGGTIKHISPSTYQMAADNACNMRKEKAPLTDAADYSEYAEPDISGYQYSDEFSTTPLLSSSSRCPTAFSTLKKTSTLPMNSSHLLMASSTLPLSSSHYASSDLCASPLRKTREESPLSSKHRFAIYDQLYATTLPEIRREQLHFIERIGQGEFGEVHLCRLEKRRVAVKMLSSRGRINESSSASSSPDSGYDDEAELSFEREMRVLGALKHANVVEVIGVCLDSRPLACVMEYMENGDVKRYMQRHPEIDSSTALSMCTQIAAGMSYLETQGFVHRDLAARNCLLDAEFSVKIGDFGMARSLYSEEYYRVEGRQGRLPVRWMSWECMLLGKFSSSSDVWSFGVTAWEVLSRCARIPYAALAHDAVISNIHSMHSTGRLEVYLDCPPLCPPSVYRDLLLPCWNRDASTRPTFQSIHHYLQTLQHTTLSR